MVIPKRWNIMRAALSEDMTVFPAEGSIVEEKDLVVVKLSEITERPAVDWW